MIGQINSLLLGDYDDTVYVLHEMVPLTIEELKTQIKVSNSTASKGCRQRQK